MVKKGYGGIHREDRETSLDIKLNTRQEDLPQLTAEIDHILENTQLPLGYSITTGERQRRIESEGDERNFALMLAIVCVFLLMGVLFESVFLPLVIVAAIPFAFLGVYWMLYLTDTALDVMAGVGLIILVGIVVNNGIVLVDTIHQNIKASTIPAPRQFNRQSLRVPQGGYVPWS